MKEITGDQMKTRCHDCVYYDELCQDCTKAQYDGCALLEDKCTIFKARKECKHRYEKCYENCSILCHSCPSDRGCEFWFECDLDDHKCDEKCEKHEARHKLNSLSEKLSKLHDSKRLLESLIEEYKIEIHTLKEKINSI